LLSVLALQRMTGNRAATQLLRAPVNDPPEGVNPGVALPTGTTTPDACTVKVRAGQVGNVDRVLLDGLPGSQGRGWDDGAADKGHIAVTGKGPRGHRGRAIAIVPHGMKGDRPVSVVVHLHGMDIYSYKGSSGMRETGDRPEDVKYFQIPQQLEAFTKKHPEARVVVLMPLGVTAGGMSKFGIDDFDDFDAYLDAALGQLGLSGKNGTLYLSAHSGGGFTISGLASNVSWHPKRYRFGGVFAFESVHDTDIDAWQRLIRGHLGADLAELRKRRRVAGAQLDYLHNEGFRFAAFGGYRGRVMTLRRTILDWFAKHRDDLRDVMDDSRVLDLLWRNYQAAEEDAGHMEALSKSSHFESVLESLVDAGAAAKPTPAAAPKQPGDPKPVRVDEHATRKAQAEDEHKHESKPLSHTGHRRAAGATAQDAAASSLT
jgi:hypothetical protein